jgi:iron(III) transport system substrate-binding protein
MAKNGSNESALMRMGVGLAVATLVLAGCGSGLAEIDEDVAAGGAPVAVPEAEWKSVVEDATAEGEVVVYTSLAGAEAVWEGFEAAYPGIKVVVERAPSGDLIAKAAQEQQAGASRADVMFHEQVPWYREQAEKDQFAQLKLGPDAQKDDWATLLGDDRYVTLIALPFSIAWNTKNADPVASIEEIITEHPDAKVGLFDPNVTPGLSYQYKVWEDTYGSDLLDRLAELDTKVFGSATPMSQSLASGEIDYAFPMTPILGPLKAEKAPVDSGLSGEDAVALPRVAGTMATAPHPNAAQVFVNWLMTEEGQRALAETFAPSTPRLAISGEIPWENVDLFDPDDWTNKDAEEWVEAEWTGRF